VEKEAHLGLALAIFFSRSCQRVPSSSAMQPFCAGALMSAMGRKQTQA
jgi:hypothetical protein